MKNFIIRVIIRAIPTFVAVAFLIMAGLVLCVYAENRDRKASSGPIVQAAEKMTFEFKQAFTLSRHGPGEGAPDILKVELVEDGPQGVCFKRVVARLSDGLLCSAIAGDVGITNGDQVVFIGLANQGIAGNHASDQHIYVARKLTTVNAEK